MGSLGWAVVWLEQGVIGRKGGCTQAEVSLVPSSTSYPRKSWQSSADSRMMTGMVGSTLILRGVFCP